MTSAKYNLLDSYNANTLGSMAEAAGLTIRQGNKKLAKANLVALMEKEFFTEARIKASLARLSPLEREVLERLQRRQGQVTSSALKRELLRANLIKETPQPTKKSSSYYGYEANSSYAGSPANQHTGYFEDVLAQLTYQGLVFSYFPDANPNNNYQYKFEFSPSSHLFIPPFIQQFLPPPPPPKVHEATNPEQTKVSTADFLLRELYLYWDFVRRTPLPLIQTGLVGKRSLKLLNGQLMRPDTTFESTRQESDMPHLYQLRQMLQALGLIKIRNNTLEVPENERVELPAFWKLSQVEMVRKCLEAEVSLIGVNYLSEESANYGPQQIPARKLVVTQIQSQPVNTWLEVDQVLEAVQNQNENFLFAYRTDVERNRYNSGYYGYGIYHYGDRRELIQKLQSFEEAFVRGVIGSFLFDMGLVELGFRSAAAAAKNEWYAFRLTPLGAAAFGNPSTLPTPTDQGRLIIQPNFQLLALGPVSLSVLAQLDLFAARQKIDQGVVEYQLTRDSVYAAQQANFTVPQIITFLTQTTGQALPQNVQRSLEEWGAHHDRIVFRRSALLLQAASPELLENLTLHGAVGKYLARPLTPDVALVVGKKKQVVAALLDADLLPAISAVTPESADKSVVIDVAGRVEAVHAVPGLHVSGRISRLADEVEPRRWQITEGKIRQAGGNKKKVEAIVQELARLNRGELPASLVTQIKAWGGYYGAAAVETLTLMEFRDKETLDELLKHEGLRPHLQPFAAQDRALAVVAEKSLPHITQILTELGVTIREAIVR